MVLEKIEKLHSSEEYEVKKSPVFEGDVYLILVTSGSPFHLFTSYIGGLPSSIVASACEIEREIFSYTRIVSKYVMLPRS